MKKYKSFFICFIALLLLLTCLCSCSEKDETEDSESVSDTGAMSEPEGNEFAKDNIAYYKDTWRE